MSNEKTRSMPPFIELFRPKQQVKNALVVIAPVLAGVHWDSTVMVSIVMAFVSLALVSAATYTFNDLRDRKLDSMHPTKSLRPIARGAVSPPLASAFVLVSLVTALVIAAAVDLRLLLVVGAYAVITTSYSLGLKRVPVLELVIVSLGFVLRILAGAAAVDTGVTDWFLIVIGAGALMVIIAKRESEERRVQDVGGIPRGVLSSYSLDYLAGLRATISAVVLTTGCIATFAKAHEVSIPVLVQVSVVPFALVILEFNRVAAVDGVETPEQIAYANRVIQISGALWVIAVVGGVYG